MEIILEDNAVKVILLVSNDWEGLYVDRILVAEGHNINNPQDWVNWTREFNISKVKTCLMIDEDIQTTERTGVFEKFLDDFKGDYN